MVVNIRKFWNTPYRQCTFLINLFPVALSFTKHEIETSMILLITWVLVILWQIPIT